MPSVAIERAGLTAQAFDKFAEGLPLRFVRCSFADAAQSMRDLAEGDDRLLAILPFEDRQQDLLVGAADLARFAEPFDTFESLQGSLGGLTFEGVARGFGFELEPQIAARFIDEWNKRLIAVSEPVLQLFQISRQLQNALHERLYRAVSHGDRAVQQRLREFFQMFCQAPDTGEFQHDQRAMHLVQGRETGPQTRFVLVRLTVRLERRSSTVEGFQQIALDPLEGKMFPVLTHRLRNLTLTPNEALLFRLWLRPAREV